MEYNDGKKLDSYAALVKKLDTMIALLKGKDYIKAVESFPTKELSAVYP